MLMKKIGIYLLENKKIGGAWQINLMMLSALNKISRRNYEIVIFQEEDVWYKYLSSRIKIVSLKRKRIPKILTTIVSRIFKSQRIISFFSNLLDPHIRTINQEQCDLVIFPTQDDNSFKINSRTLTTIWDLMHIYEGQFAEYTNKEKARRNRKYQNICNFTSTIVVESETTKKHILTNFDVERKKIKVLPLTYSPYLNNPKKFNVKKKFDIKKKYIFYPAQFWEQKNHINLILAFKKVLQNYDINLVLSGAKKINYQKVKDLIKKLKLEKKIKIIGFVHEKYIYSLYKNAVCVTYVSRTGPTNVPPLEALKVGTPLICSDVYEMKKQVGHKSAIFVDPTNIVEIQKSIERLLKDKKLRKKLIQNGKKTIEKLSLESYEQKFNSIVKETII